MNTPLELDDERFQDLRQRIKQKLQNLDQRNKEILGGSAKKKESEDQETSP